MYDRWAESRQAKADAAHQASRDATAGIPFGQPILVGHHSQRRHERAIERGWNQLGKAVEHGNMAKHHTRKADAQEAWADEVLRRANGPRYSKADLLPGDRVVTGDGDVTAVIVRVNVKSVTAWPVYRGHPVDTPTDELRPIWPQLRNNGARTMPYLKVRSVWRQGDDGTWFEVPGQENS